MPEGTCLTRPNGGFVIWAQLPAESDAMAIHGRARAEGISVAPGPIFSASGEFHDCLRLNAAVPWGARLGQIAREA